MASGEASDKDGKKVTVGDVVDALRDIELWIRDLEYALNSMPRNTELPVPRVLGDNPNVPRMFGGCPGPE